MIFSSPLPIFLEAKVIFWVSMCPGGSAAHSHVTHTGAVLTQCSLWEPQIYHYQIYKYQFIPFLLARTSHCQSITEQSPQPRLMWEYFQWLPVIAALLGNLLKFHF